MKSLLKRLFLQLDLFSVNPTFYINNSQTHKTTLGAIVSILIMLFMIFSFISLMQDVSEGSNPTVNSQEVLMKLDDKYEFEQSDFVFAVNVFKRTGELLVNEELKRYYSIEFSQCRKSQEGQQCKPIQTEQCGQSLVDISQEYNWSNQSSYTSTCISQQYRNNNKIFLQNPHYTNNFNTLTIQILKCTNTTSIQSILQQYQDCASPQEIDQALYGANVVSMQSVKQYTPDKQQPFVSSIQISENTIWPQTRKQITLFHKLAISETINNLWYFFPSSQISNSILYQRSQSELTNQEQDDHVLIYFTLQLESQKQKFIRSYRTIFDAFAQVGGLFSIIKVVLSMGMIPIQQLQMKLYILNTVKEGSQKDLKVSQVLSYFSNTRTRSESQQNFQKIEKYLDIIEILKRPLKLEKEIEDLRSSIKCGSQGYLFYPQLEEGYTDRQQVRDSMKTKKLEQIQIKTDIPEEGEKQDLHKQSLIK